MRRRHLGAGLALVAAALLSLLGAAPAGAQFGFLEKWGSSGSLDGQFEIPLGVGTDSAGNVYVGDGGPNDRIQKFTSNGGFLDKWGSSGTAEGQFNEPHAVDTNAAGNVFGADAIQNRIQSFDSAGGFRSCGAGTSRSEAGICAPPTARPAARPARMTASSTA